MIILYPNSVGITIKTILLLIGFSLPPYSSPIMKTLFQGRKFRKILSRKKANYTEETGIKLLQI